MKSNFESMEEMQKMQQEAVRRVQEMQKRAKQSLEADKRHIELNKEENLTHQQKISDNGDTLVQTKNSDLIQNVNGISKKINSKQNSTKTNSNKMNIFSTLLNDKEKSLILVLILILVDESSDLSLILALMYLII